MYVHRVLFFFCMYQVYEYEMRILFIKKYVKFGKMIKSALFKVYSIASYTFLPSFGQFVNTTSVQIFPFCCELFVEPFFHIFVRTKALLSKCVTHHCKQGVIRRNQVQSDFFQAGNYSNWSIVVSNIYRYPFRHALTSHNGPRLNGFTKH